MGYTDSGWKRENEITETGLWKTRVGTSHLTSESGFNDKAKRLKDELETTLLSSNLTKSCYLASATVPHILHVLMFASFIHRSITGFSCVPRSVTWKETSLIMVGSS
jgi:hypothetical protein